MRNPTRVALLVATAVVAGLALFVYRGSGGSRSRVVANADPSTSASTSSTSASTSSTTVAAPPTTTTTTTTDHTFRIGVASLSISAYNSAGAAAIIPTTVWYPLGVSGRTFPLVMFSPGYQIAPSAYDALTEAWAAAGYVVAEPVYPFTAPGSPQDEYDMVNHPGELSQVLTDLLRGDAPGEAAFAGLIDGSEVALAGHSDGGDVSLAAAANSAHAIPGIKAALILSGAEWSPFGGSYFSAGNPPLLAVQGAQDTINPPGCSAQLYDGASAPRYYLDLPNATHESPYLVAGSQQAVVEKVTTDFLDGYLKGMKPRLLDLAVQGNAPGVSQLITGASVPITGGCPGAPAGA